MELLIDFKQWVTPEFITNIIGSIGVTLMLAAYWLNITDRVDDDDFIYIILNAIGGFLAFISSYLINYIPFMVLEGVWTLVSIWGIYDYVIRMKKNKN